MGQGMAGAIVGHTGPSAPGADHLATCQHIASKMLIITWMRVVAIASGEGDSGCKCTYEKK
jgi:hypothetical protein